MALTELIAGPDWQAVDFISDLHLQASEPATFKVWQRFMQTTTADAVFILGDLFEVWVGDDALESGNFEDSCVQVIQQTSSRISTFFMHGNRDFLIGSALMATCQSTLLPDPTIFMFQGNRWLLSHGDALCTDDTAYMQFRQLARSQSWQQSFLARPLADRQAIAGDLRAQSEALKISRASYADVNVQAARQLLLLCNAQTLIHGHTHMPGWHDLGDGMARVVLSDWDMQVELPRAEVLRLSATGLQRIDLS